MNFKALSGGIPISGAHFLIELEDKRIVIDCGAVQTGGKVLPPPIAKGRIDALFLTHGHLDHIGMLPIFVNEHPDTPVYGTKVTWRFARMLLWDSFRVAMHKLERGEKVETYFSASDIERALNLKKFNLVREPEWFSPWPGWKIRFWPAGHINGAASIHIVSPKGFRIIHSANVMRLIIQQCFMKQFKNTRVFVCPATRSCESMPFDREYGKLPVFFS